MAAVAENASVSNTALTTAAPTIVLARQALRRQISDLAQATGTGVALDTSVDAIALDMTRAFQKRGTAMIGALSSGFSSSVGSTGVDLSVTTFYSAIFQLQLNSANGPLTAILAPQQLNDLMSSLRSETGPGQYLAPTQEMLNAHGQGYAGTLFGVDIFKSANGVPTANAGADYRAQSEWRWPAFPRSWARPRRSRFRRSPSSLSATPPMVAPSLWAAA
jgi:hypothetical protein